MAKLASAGFRSEVILSILFLLQQSIVTQKLDCLVRGSVCVHVTRALKCLGDDNLPKGPRPMSCIKGID